MFKLSLCLIAALIVCAQAGGDYDKIQVVKSEQNVDQNGFLIDLQLSDGSIQQRDAHIEQRSDSEVISEKGHFGWTDPNGEVISIQYTADENGYHPVGDHLPTPPPIPEAIQKALEYIQAHPPKEDN